MFGAHSIYWQGWRVLAAFFLLNINNGTLNDIGKLIYFWIIHLMGKNCVEGHWTSSHYILVKKPVHWHMQLLAEVYFIRKCLTFASWKHVIWMWLGSVCFLICQHELNNYGFENNLKSCFLASYCLVRRIVGVYTSCSLHAFNLTVIKPDRMGALQNGFNSHVTFRTA